jgi:hypothetical protein
LQVWVENEEEFDFSKMAQIRREALKALEEGTAVVDYVVR